MAKDENSNGASPNGASANDPDPPGFTRFGFIDEEDRIFVEAQHAAFKKTGEELAAEGVDGTAEYEQLLADFGLSST